MSVGSGWKFGSMDAPLAAMIDPEERVRAYEVGVPVSELMRRPKGEAQQAIEAGSETRSPRPRPAR